MTQYTDLCGQAEKALEGVTEGPWESSADSDPLPYNVMPRVYSNPSGGALGATLLAEVGNLTLDQDEWEANARFIAFTRAWVPAAAAAIRELAAERDQWRVDCEEFRRERDAAEAKVARLEGALADHNDLLRSAFMIASREGVDGEIGSTNWDAYYNRVTVVLKRHHETANEARAALTEGTPE